MRDEKTIDSIPELALVALRKSREYEGGVLPEGTTGTVVFVYRDAVGYEIEFDEPFHCVVTLARDDIQPV
jgi:hypothetical protein